VRLSGYTPSPLDNSKVVKTSLGAEKSVGLKQFDSTADAIAEAKKKRYTVIAAEVTKKSMPLASFSHDNKPIAVIFGNEVDGVLDSTLKLVDEVVHIPMQGIKESVNVGQTSAIFMRALAHG
jgi:tRNA G18 (ribose-2'-O)-methylase SpoU